MFTALLDTNALWPSLLRDFLLSLGIEGLYRPVWSEAILEELEYQEARKLKRRGVAEPEAAARAAHLVEQMRAHFDVALVFGWEGLEGTYELPDSNDEHVLATSVFAHNTVSLGPRQAMLAVDQIVARSGIHGPPRSADEILKLLVDRYRLDDAVACLRDGAKNSLAGTLNANCSEIRLEVRACRTRCIAVRVTLSPCRRRAMCRTRSSGTPNRSSRVSASRLVMRRPSASVASARARVSRPRST